MMNIIRTFRKSRTLSFFFLSPQYGSAKLTRSSFYVRAGNCEWEWELELVRVHVHLQKRRMYTADYLRTRDHLLISRMYVCPSISVSPWYMGSIFCCTCNCIDAFLLTKPRKWIKLKEELRKEEKGTDRENGFLGSTTSIFSSLLTWWWKYSYSVFLYDFTHHW